MKTAIINVTESGTGSTARVLRYGIRAGCTMGMRQAAELAAIKAKYFPCKVDASGKRIEEEGITLKETARSINSATYLAEWADR